eukprot:CAMPEP_0181327578 /NCGR_PEP_ID=MMETSP1101-20121128/22185_1 /TAXON_ID=46948 /ORGANISM="Rhodomonas abbreviata, Strain Caron Lab Isolate" /LENGTH=324 /DNA_ID=CAMNT_0023436265 /DNA_START=148 /DNA_END=1122 /DNA_ORIENTATION=-
MKAASLDIPTIELNDGTKHPMIGFGTYKVGFIPASASAAAAGAQQAGGTKVTARECVRAALDVGYRFLDCAEFYGNEEEVGLAIQDSGIDRKDLFLASKVWTDKIYQGKEAVRAQVEKTLRDLQTDYLDLYLVHWPVPGGKHVDAYKVLEEMKAEGKIRSLGVSNYAIEDYEELQDACSVPPAINQIEVNPFLYRRNTIEYFQKKGVQIQAYRALRDGKAFDHPLVVQIATKYSKSPAQILGRWCVQKNVIYIPKSVKRERMEENAAVFDFELDPDDVSELDKLTTQDNIQKFRELYEKCVIRDTPWADTDEGKKLVKVPVTYD